MTNRRHCKTTVIPAAVYGILALMPFVSCSAAAPDLDDPAVLGRILVEAVDADRLQQRGAEEALLYYAPNESEPYTDML